MIISGKANGIATVFSEGGSFAVPVYQREYAWKVGKSEKDDNQVIEFWQSLAQNYKKGKNGDVFFGTMIFVEQKNGTRKVKNILDGQQRFTTFFLLCKALIVEINVYLEKISLNKYKINKNHIQKLIEENDTLKSWIRGSQGMRLQSNHTDQPLLQIIFNENPFDKKDFKQTESHKRIIEAYDKLRFEVKNEFFADEPTTDKIFNEKLSNVKIFMEYLLDFAKVLPLEIDEIEDAYTLFESMNNTGASLEPEDLLKNHFYKTVPQKSHNLITQKWQIIRDSVKGFGLTNFLLYYYQAQYGDVRKNQLFKSIKDKASNVTAIDTILSELVDFSRYLNYMLKPDSIGYFREPSTVVCLEGFKAMGVRLAYLPLMKVLHVLSGDKKKFNEVIKIFRNIFLVFIKIGGQSTNDLQSYFAKSFCQDLTVHNIDSKLSQLVKKFSIDENDFDARFTNMPFKNDLSKYLLLEIELHQTSGGKILFLEKWDLEHIIPKDLSDDEWKKTIAKSTLPEYFESNGENVSRRDFIGNHTLWHQSDNRGNKNAGFSFKKKTYKLSQAKLTKALGKEKDFNYENVINRTKILRDELKEALLLFPKPKNQMLKRRRISNI